MRACISSLPVSLPSLPSSPVMYLIDSVISENITLRPLTFDDCCRRHQNHASARHAHTRKPQVGVSDHLDWAKIMSVNGVKQLSKLTLSYSLKGGSSRGVRYDSSHHGTDKSYLSCAQENGTERNRKSSLISVTFYEIHREVFLAYVMDAWFSSFQGFHGEGSHWVRSCELANQHSGSILGRASVVMERS